MSKLTKAKKLFIVDFDDTIFPTTWAVGFFFEKDYPLPENFSNYVTELMIFLSMAQKLGKVVIVTNSTQNWVTKGSSELFTQNGFADATKLVTGVDKIVYARETYPTVSQDDAKFFSFRDLLSEFEGDRVIAMGDHQNDLDNFKRAIKDAKEYSHLFIKFNNSPSFNDLFAQLKLLNSKLLDLTLRDNTSSEMYFD